MQMKKNIDDIDSNVNNVKLIVNIQDQVKNINHDTDTTSSGPPESLNLSEIKERSTRSNNLIMYGLHEVKGVRDINPITNLLSLSTSHVTDCPSFRIIHTQRTGKKQGGKSQLLPVLSDNPIIVRFVLQLPNN